MSESFGVLFSRDLFFTSKITGTAQQLGYRMQMITSMSDLIARVQQSGCKGVLLDLNNPGLDLTTLFDSLAADRRPKIFAYGPHVQTAKFEAARDMGCDDVIPHSRLSSELPRILEQLYS